MWFERPRKRTTVRTEWMRLWPKRGRQMSFWIAVGKKVRERGVRHRDLQSIRLICEETEHEFN